jgi:UDP-N-acetylglucosamine 2-epimerase (non-hydrolysing)
MKKIWIVAGTRPNFIKITQFKRVAAEYHSLDIKIVHTGQHFDKNMTDVFFKELNITPDYFLHIQPASPVQQIAEIIIKLDKLANEIGKPDLIIVPGDVNSTLAGAVFANKSEIPLAHLEAGLRSFDTSMPEEYNRIVADHLAQYLFVTEESGKENLMKEQCTGNVYMVGNTMIDTLKHFEEQIEKSQISEKLKVEPENYALVTIHRPSNVDKPENLKKVIEVLNCISNYYKVVFPVHPRTEKKLKEFSLFENLKLKHNIIFCEPLGYLDFQKLIKYSKFVLTDSGGVQEETTYRQIPCLTLRKNTERPVTCTIGTNTLLPFDIKSIEEYILQIKNNQYKKGAIPPLWDGQATERVVKILNDIL